VELKGVSLSSHIRFHSFLKWLSTNMLMFAPAGSVVRSSAADLEIDDGAMIDAKGGSRIGQQIGAVVRR
jgi:hypothetical protein